MPNIPTYNAPFPSINVNDRAEEAYRQQAREVGSLGREGLRVLEQGAEQIGQGLKVAGEVVQQHQDWNAQMTGVRSLADMNLTNQKELNDTIANNTPDTMPNALAQWSQSATDRLDKWQTQFSGSSRKVQLWAEEQAAHIKLETAKKMALDSGVNAGTKVHWDTLHAVNSIFGSLSANSTVLDVDNALKTFSTLGQVASQNPSLTTPELKAHAQKTVEDARAQGLETSIYKMVDNSSNPPQMADYLGRYYKDFLTPQQQRAITEHSQNVNRQQFWQNRAIDQDKERADKKAADDALKGLTRSTFSVREDGTPSGERFVPPDYFSKAMEISKMPGANEGTLRSAVHDAQEIWNRTKNGVVATTDPTTYHALFAKAYNGLTDKDVFDAHASGKLSDHDSTMFHQAINDADRNPQKAEQKRQFDQFINTYAKGLILKSNIMNPSAWEAERLQQFENDKWKQYQDALATPGVRTFDLLDQRNPAFIGKDIDRYQLTQQQQMKAITDKTQGGLKPLPPVGTERKPGESLKDFDKRTSGGTP